MTAEQWRPVVGYDGVYEVSDHGNVRSLDRMVQIRDDGRQRHERGRLLSPGHDHHGYRLIVLRAHGARRTRWVHQLVLEAFIGPKPLGQVTRHLDGDPTNNHLSNLTWGTYSENVADRVAHGRHGWAARSKCDLGHELVASNLVPSRLAIGKRTCLACYRARDTWRRACRRGVEIAFSAVANQKYAEITKEATS